MTIRAPFQPARGTNQIAASAAASGAVSIDRNAKSVRIVNAGTTNIAHIRIGPGAQTATVADMPILPGQAVIVSKGEEDTTLAHISTAGTTLHIQTGEGGY